MNPILAMLIGLVIYFVVGLFRDWLATMFYRCVSREWAGSASILSGGITLFDIIIVATVIRSGAWLNALAYALGSGAGTFIAMKNTRLKK
jgi:hypothetical protein